MKLKLKFHGPNTVSRTTKEEPMAIGHAISFETALIREPTLADQARFFEMERTFNELTTGRLHVELVP